MSEERAARYLEVQNSQEFAALRKKFRGFVFPMTGAFLAWYFLYVVLATYATDFMSQKLFGNITVGLVLGLLQFVTTFAITMYYARWADRELDPAAEKLAEHMERGTLQ
ncbi:MAG: DUF485 domain-containing protein [Actinomycetales bacterium]|nr:DUF485 domain-containing protein [Actinomycetales bacterium]